jgi:uncharacterized protein YggE
MKTFVGAFVLLALSAGYVHGQTAPRRTSIRTAGDASVFVTPDQVSIGATVTTRGASAQEASASNATRITAVLAALTNLLGAGADIKTVNYFVGPVYTYPQNASPVLVDYVANNTVQVTLGSISTIGAVIDTATQAGATSVGGLQFSIKDPEPARRQALQQATLQAKNHADAMASGVGAKVGAIVSIQETTVVRTTGGIAGAGGAAGGAAPTPVEPGRIQITASIIFEAELN